MDLKKQIEALIDTALSEEIGEGDITTKTCLADDTLVDGKFVSKQAGVVAGLPFIVTLFEKIDPRVEVKLLVEEGSYQKTGIILATIKGPAQSIVAGERVALNFLQHASGVATKTAAYVRKVKGYGCEILDTRKTLPGLRALEKYAVKLGGGTNHRFGLHDRFVVKLNHIAFLSKTHAEPISEAIKLIKSKNPQATIEVEVDSEEHLKQALNSEAAILHLRHMLPNEIKLAVKRIRQTNKKVYIESGAITLETVKAFAETGVDGISIGELTHSVEAIDMGIRLHIN